MRIQGMLSAPTCSCCNCPPLAAARAAASPAAVTPAGSAPCRPAGSAADNRPAGIAGTAGRPVDGGGAMGEGDGGFKVITPNVPTM